MKITRPAILLILVAIIMAAPLTFSATATPIATLVAAVQPNISINTYYASNKVQRGRTIQGTVVLDIPGGYHVNSNRPSGKYLVPTSLKFEPRDGVRVGAVRYPRATLRSFSFSDQKLSVFEGRTVMVLARQSPRTFRIAKWS